MCATKSNDSRLWSDTFDLPNPGLRAYFSHVESGNSDEYRTPFYKKKSLEEILSGWDNTLKSIQHEWPTLYEFEKDLANKVGPTSIMKPLIERMGDIDSYYDLISLDQVPISDAALQRWKKEWSSLRGLRIRSVDHTVKVMKKSTNSGSPYFSKRRVVTDKTVPFSLSSPELEVTQTLPTGKWNAAAVLGWRGQEGGPEADDVKQRVVWMFPYAVNIDELRVYQPLIEGCQRFGLVPAWVSMDAVDQRITRLFDTKNPSDLVICTDFSKFDQHFNASLQDAANLGLSYLFTNNEESVRWLNTVFPIKYKIPLAYAWEKIRFGLHGMGSGSGGTNADETIVHRMLQHEVAAAHGAELNPNSQCLGDDGIICYPRCSVKDVVDSYCSHGLEMNLDKQYASKHDCTYLRRWHHKDYRVDGVCVGVYSTMRALGRLAEQERYYDPETWGAKMVALRELSIIENTKWHPLREKFADYCMKGDKYRLGLDIPGFLDDIERIAKKATDYMPDFLGYTKSLQYEVGDKSETGIASWWIVDYLKSKR